MSLLVVGVSHHHAPLELLEAVALDGAEQTRLEALTLRSEHVAEALVVSTCNRTEIYAECVTFHGALADLTEALASVCRVARSDLQPHLYVHYEERAIAHAFTVAAGLDSMAVGEAQILGQMRSALTRAQRHRHVGPALNGLFQHALRVGKRVHSQTGIDQVAGSLVGASLDAVERSLGPISTLCVAVIGAGGMGALAAATIAKRGAGDLLIVNRGRERGLALAERVGGRSWPLEDLAGALAQADVVICSTGATGVIVTAPAVADVRAGGGRARFFVDLALPHDIDRGVADVVGVQRIDLADLGEALSATPSAPQVREASDLVTAEVAAYGLSRSAEAVAPTVSALRARAGDVVESELERFNRRVEGLTPAQHDEVERTVRRVVDKLLHTPTVRVKELARDGQGGSYARALSELFDLDPRDVSLVSTPPILPGEEP